MEATSTFVLKPIGHMKSVFHFKNGTPRQSSLCENARGILDIDKSVFSNPDHSLDGLQHYSHAWILFIFHKNNNVHKKAKVKPPRLNGQRVGVFSTRSPYRPNNIGLSLVKIDKIQGASIHFSGIDILDGTPIIDIKPYIPEYDRPSTVCDLSPSLTNESVDQWTHGSATSSTVVNTNASPDTSSDHNRHQGIHSSCSSSFEVGSKSFCSSPAFSENKCSSLEEGFYSLSAALDQAGETLRHGVEDKNWICNDGDNDRQHLFTDNDSDSSQSKGVDFADLNNKCASESPGNNKCASESPGNNKCASESPGENSGHLERSNEVDGDDDNLLDFLVEDVICRAASDVLLTGDDSLSEENSSNVSGDVKSIKSASSASNRLTASSEATNSREATGMNNFDDGGNPAVIAPWLSSPPVAKVRVIFSAESLNQLQSFRSDAANPRHRTEMLSGPEDARKAITSVLHEEPRSVYRRRKCQNTVYFFVIDVLHVACWFDGNVVTVLRIEHVADVPHLQGKKEIQNWGKKKQ